MILLEVRDYFKDFHQGSVMDISKHFKIQASAAIGMIEFWLNKGYIEKCNSACQKKSCGGCSMTFNKYQWIGI